ncbi:MAG TPA: hypothetical protein VIV65_09665, partial [Gemmatimonadaceae bacterium]
GATLVVGGVGRPATVDLARELYESVHGKLLRFSDHVQVFPNRMGDEKPSTTIGFERRFNAALQLSAKEDFVRYVLSAA